MNLLSVREARERILSHFQPVTTEALPAVESLNRILAQDVTALDDLPPFDNSSMDGFAIRAIDVADAKPASPRTLRVVADIPAGSPPTVSITSGEAARIMTGAPLPLGADAVIPVEDTNFQDRAAGAPPPPEVTIFKNVTQNENIRQRGADIRTGETALQKGRQLKPQDVALLASLGYSTVNVFRKPRVALFSSGDELLDASQPLEPGKIRDSNSHMLAGLIESAGAEVEKLGTAKDTYESVKAALDKTSALKVDLILSSAGVSVGAFDYVKSVIESNGKMDFWRVNMRPGKPLAFGEYNGAPFIGLPGNPVSAFVGFEVFVRAALGRLAGQTERNRLAIRARCEGEINSDGRESYLRANLREENGSLVARLTGHQGSGNILSLAQADALLIIPAGVKCVPAGQEVEAWLL
ncbi:MAG TPA: molybdopterin molybdotransferase MoeA [Anaerolineales bacterium]|nr:molybdopterin molybdotransferase MoeA [Anaerolineales bacterium]